MASLMSSSQGHGPLKKDRKGCGNPVAICSIPVAIVQHDKLRGGLPLQHQESRMLRMFLTNTNINDGYIYRLYTYNTHLVPENNQFVKAMPSLYMLYKKLQY
jgi:hypothetical protein